MTERHYVTGLYSDAATAQKAVEHLIDESFPSEEIGILVRDEAGIDEGVVEHQSGIAQGATAGSAVGATLGAVGAGLISLGTLPALGLGLAAAGPIAAAASGVLAGAAGGGLLGTLAGLGFWTESPELPEDLRRGAVLVSVPAASARAANAREALDRAGAEWIQG